MIPSCTEPKKVFAFFSALTDSSLLLRFSTMDAETQMQGSALTQASMRSGTDVVHTCQHYDLKIRKRE